MFDVITIGSATLDAFIETDAASIVSVYQMKTKKDFMSYPYGSKIEIDKFDFKTGGGGLNTAMNFATLGLKTSAILKIGDETEGKNIISAMKDTNVDTSNLIYSKEYMSGFSIILISFQGDRTVLAHRGANAHIKKSEINFDAIKNSKWLYIAPLNGDSTKVLDDIAQFAEKNDVNMAINVGTSSIKKGAKYLEKILKTAEVVIMNREEATMLTEITIRPDTKEEKFSDKTIHPDMVKMLKKLKSTHAKIVIITDGKDGAYAYDGKKFYHAPEFPAKVVSTLGAGDAFASTFVATLSLTNNDMKKALAAASITAASTVEKFGAQDGFLTYEQIIEKAKQHPEYKVDVLEIDD